jgi:hypothetical protein
MTRCEACGDTATRKLEMYSGNSKTPSSHADVCAKCEARARKRPMNVWTDIYRRRDMLAAGEAAQ